MNNRRAIVIAAVVVIAIGAVVVLTLRSFAPSPAATTVEPPVATTAEVPAEQPANPAAREPEPPPPWLQPQSPTAESAVAAAATAAADSEQAALRKQQMAKLHDSMRGVIASATARAAETNQHLSEMVDTLEAMDDPAVTSQIDLAAVRHNLEISIRVQEIAQQLQQLGMQPDSPERQQRLDASTAELRRLQSQLRTDVRAPGSTLPAPPALPASR